MITLSSKKREVRILESGDSFGELALLDNGCKTTATVVAKSVCELSCIDKQQFWEILGKIKKKEVEDKLNFLQKIQLF